MYLLIVVIKNEELIDDLITGWLDIGITETTVIETTDSLQLISHHIPIFAGFRSLTSGGMRHNKTLFTIIEREDELKLATGFLEALCKETGKLDQGFYFVTPVNKFNRLGVEEEPDQRKQDAEKKTRKSKKKN